MGRRNLLILSTFLMTLLSTPCSLADGPESSYPIRFPARGHRVRILATHKVVVPGDSSVFARTGMDPLVLIPGEMDKETFEARGPLGMIRGGRLQKLKGQWSIGLTGTEPRATLGESEPFVVISGSPSGGYATEPVHAMLLRDLLAGKSESEAVELPTGLRSPLLMRSGIRLLATGYTYEQPTDRTVKSAPGLGEEQAQNVAIYDLSGGSPSMAAMIERFSEHCENNLAAGVTKDGVVNLLATEVLVSRGNRSRVHLMLFDPLKHLWMSDRILFERQEFTSTMTPRVVVKGATVDAFWLPEGGSTQGKSDGLYVHRIGESVTWRLTNSRGQYAILPDADSHGSLLVGVAVNPGEDGRIAWFIRRDDRWIDCGMTDLGTKLYTLSNTGTEPFALWKDSSDAVHAAFRSAEGLRMVDLKLPQ